MSKKSFTSWFFESLKVERMPVPGEVLRRPRHSHLINVSDEYIHANHQMAVEAGVFHHWFPLNECTGQMGLNSLFAALCVLFDAEQQDVPVLLHCHAGVNRSPTVRCAYYFMRTGQHLREMQLQKGILVNFTDEREDRSEPVAGSEPNMLEWNCTKGLLPPTILLEKFLKLLGTKLEDTKTQAANRGGLLTQLKFDTGLQ